MTKKHIILHTFTIHSAVSGYKSALFFHSYCPSSQKLLFTHIALFCDTQRHLLKAIQPNTLNVS